MFPLGRRGNSHRVGAQCIKAFPRAKHTIVKCQPFWVKGVFRSLLCIRGTEVHGKEGKVTEGEKESRMGK